MNEDTMKDLVRRIADPDKVSPFSNGFVTLTDEEMVKFAELLIQECISKCEFVANMATITNVGEMARKTKATADSCATMIKQHFGIKV